MKLAAVRAFQEQVKRDYKGSSTRGGTKSKYNKEEVNNLLSEMQVDLQNVLSGSLSDASEGDASLRLKNLREKQQEEKMKMLDAEKCFQLHEEQLLESLHDAESYLNMKERWVGSERDEDGGGGSVKKKNSKFKAAVNAVMFVGATKSGVRFSTKSVRQFDRNTSFWDHDFWDEQKDERLSTSSTNASQSLNSSAASILKESFMNEWESRVSMMPSKEELERACLKLVVIWVETGHFPKNKSPKWERKFGKLSPADLVYHRVHRYPVVALHKLATLCDRPPTFFVDDTKRQEMALLYLYDTLAMWENGEVTDIQDIVLECRKEIAKSHKEEQKNERKRTKETSKQKWDAFVGKLETGMRKLFKTFAKT